MNNTVFAYSVLDRVAGFVDRTHTASVWVPILNEVPEEYVTLSSGERLTLTPEGVKVDSFRMGYEPCETEVLPLVDPATIGKELVELALNHLEAELAPGRRPPAQDWTLGVHLGLPQACRVGQFEVNCVPGTKFTFGQGGGVWGPIPLDQYDQEAMGLDTNGLVFAQPVRRPHSGFYRHAVEERYPWMDEQSLQGLPEA